MREKLGVSAAQMGVYSVFLNCALNARVTTDSFWAVVDDQSASLHACISRNEDVASVDISPVVDFIDAHGYYTPLVNLFSLSNIGVLRYNKAENIIRLREHFVASSMRDTRMTGRVFIGISTVDGDENRLCCGISFNDKYYSCQFMAQLKEMIAALVDTLIA